MLAPRRQIAIAATTSMSQDKFFMDGASAARAANIAVSTAKTTDIFASTRAKKLRTTVSRSLLAGYKISGFIGVSYEVIAGLSVPPIGAKQLRLRHLGLREALSD